MSAPVYRVEFRIGTTLRRARLCMEGCGFTRVVAGKRDGHTVARGVVLPDVPTTYAEDALEKSYWVVWFYQDVEVEP